MVLQKKLLALLLALTLVFAIAGCSDRPEAEEESEDSSGISAEVSMAEKEEKEILVKDKTPNYKENILEKSEENEHTIGWLDIPNLGIEDVVVYHPTDNEWYLKRDFEGNKDNTGTYYADYRSTFGDGTRAELGVNTCIYGHALTDTQDHPNYGIKFGPLHELRHDIEVAKDTPYINFSTAEEDMVFEIFAVFVANADNPDLPYNSNKLPADEFYKMIQEEVLPRSLYNYDVEVKETDKFLTLSTCIYYPPDGSYTDYPNTYMRYAVMAKLVDPDEVYKDRAVLEVNEDAIIDKDGKIGSQ